MLNAYPIVWTKTKTRGRMRERYRYNLALLTLSTGNDWISSHYNEELYCVWCRDLKWVLKSIQSHAASRLSQGPATLRGKQSVKKAPKTPQNSIISISIGKLEVESTHSAFQKVIASEQMEWFISRTLDQDSHSHPLFQRHNRLFWDISSETNQLDS